MAWLYIPAETGERIETICNQHYNPGRGACDCPLWPACNYSNDLTKSSAENTRILSRAWPPLWPPSTTKTGGNNMASIERKINGTFAPVPGGYAQQINEQTTLFVPDFSAARYDPKTGELFGYAPDYAALEAEKAPAVQADKPGEYVYCYEMQQAPTGCDFAADLSYYGKHYFLRPLRDDLPQLHGRGISYDEERNTYTVTTRAYDKLKEQYRIRYETCLD